MDLIKDVHNKPITDILKALKGKELTLLLINGNQISGRLTEEEVNYGSQLTRMVHLKELVGQDNYDAIIPINAIYGVIVRARD